MDKDNQNGQKKPLFGNIFGNTKGEKILFSKKDKKLIFKLALVIVLGVILMTFSNYGSNTKSEKLVMANETNNYYGNEKALEERLEEILSKIAGAGEVIVAVSYRSVKEVEYAYNSDINKRVSTEQGNDTLSLTQDMENSESRTLVTENQNPVVVKEYMPEIQGILVVATGAGDSEVKNKLFSAVQGLLALPAHRIVISN